MISVRTRPIWIEHLKEPASFSCTLAFPISYDVDFTRLIVQVNEPMITFLKQLDEDVRVKVQNVWRNTEYIECAREHNEVMHIRIKVNNQVRVWELVMNELVHSSLDKISSGAKLHVVLKPPMVWCTRRLASVSFTAQDIVLDKAL